MPCRTIVPVWTFQKARLLRFLPPEGVDVDPLTEISGDCELRLHGHRGPAFFATWWDSTSPLRAASQRPWTRAVSQDPVQLRGLLRLGAHHTDLCRWLAILCGRRVEVVPWCFWPFALQLSPQELVGHLCGAALLARGDSCGKGLDAKVVVHFI